jgi:hypothetical protein
LAGEWVLIDTNKTQGFQFSDEQRKMQFETVATIRMLSIASDKLSATSQKVSAGHHLTGATPEPLVVPCPLHLSPKPPLEISPLSIGGFKRSNAIQSLPIPQKCQ